MIDIATLEHLIWRPVFKNGEIVDIHEFEHYHAVNVIGIERLCMAFNGYKHISECDHIKPLISALNPVAKKNNFHFLFITIECIRVIHRIISDLQVLKIQSRQRRKKFNDYLEALYMHLEKLGISSKIEIISKLLENNAELNPYYPELKENIPKTVEAIETYFHRRF